MKKILLSLLTVICLGMFTVPASASTLNLSATPQKATVAKSTMIIKEDQLARRNRYYYYDTPGYYYYDNPGYYYYSTPYYYNPGVGFYLGF